MEQTTLAAREAIRPITDDFEIIIIDDASTDRTGSIADRLATQHSRIRVIHNPTNRGYGRALRAGFAEARNDWIFYTDGDGQFDCREVSRLLPLLNRFDIVSAYRVDRQESWFRRVNGRVWTGICNILLGLRLRDVDCAFKILPRRLFEEVELRSEGALISAEILARATRLGYRIGQIGVRHYPRRAGVSTGGSVGVMARALVELVKFRREIRAVSPAGRAEGREQTPGVG